MHRCSEYRARALDRVVPDAVPAEAAPPCAECARWLARLRLQVSALAGVPRLAAPAELEDRIERELAPASLLAVAALSPRRVPAVLERLVEEELADPAGQRSRRFVGSLPGRAAPARLWQRVFEPGGSATRRWWAPLAALAAAVVLLVVVLRPEGEPEREWPFAVVRVTSPRVLDPMAQALAGGLTGGLAPALPRSAPGAPVEEG